MFIKYFNPIQLNVIKYFNPIQLNVIKYFNNNNNVLPRSGRMAPCITFRGADYNKTTVNIT